MGRLSCARGRAPQIQRDPAEQHHDGAPQEIHVEPQDLRPHDKAIDHEDGAQDREQQTDRQPKVQVHVRYQNSRLSATVNASTTTASVAGRLNQG